MAEKQPFTIEMLQSALKQARQDFPEALSRSALMELTGIKNSAHLNQFITQSKLKYISLGERTGKKYLKSDVVPALERMAKYQLHNLQSKIL